MDPWPCILVFLALVIISALIEVSTKAVLSQNQLNLKKLFPEEGKAYEKLLQTIENNKLGQIAETAHLSCIVLASCVASCYFVPKLMAAKIFSAIPNLVTIVLSFAIVFLAAMLLLLVFAKSLPAKIGVKHSDSLCFTLLPVFRFFTALCTPLYYTVDAVSGVFALLAGAKPEDVTEDVTEGEIRQMIDEGRENGNIEESETDMIHGIFEFDDRIVGEILTHRTEVVAVELSATLHEIIETAVENGYSRIPVYKETLDNVVGILYVKDLLGLIDKDHSDFKVSEHMREPLCVPETNSLKDLFERFKSERIQMAIVIDEYGGTLGIVTMEDLIESIMGSISDEYDDEEDEEAENEIAKISDNEYIIAGLALVTSVEEELDISIKNEEECDTIGGLLVSLLGMIPSEGEQPEASLDNLHFKVISVAEHRVEKLLLTVLNENEQEEASDNVEDADNDD